MNMTDAYLIEIVNYCNRWPLSLMDSECVYDICKSLNLTQAKLLKYIDLGFKKEYLKYAKKAYPWPIVPTEQGLEFARIPAESGVQP